MTWAERSMEDIVDFVERHTEHGTVIAVTDVIPSTLRFDCHHCDANLQIKVDLKDDDNPRT